MLECFWYKERRYGWRGSTPTKDIINISKVWVDFFHFVYSPAAALHWSSQAFQSEKRSTINSGSGPWASCSTESLQQMDVFFPFNGIKYRCAPLWGGGFHSRTPPWIGKTADTGVARASPALLMPFMGIKTSLLAFCWKLEVTFFCPKRLFWGLPRLWVDVRSFGRGPLTSIGWGVMRGATCVHTYLKPRIQDPQI